MEFNLGDNIRAARTKQNLTQEKLAELSGLSLNFISSLERTNTSSISIKNAYKIADALGVPLTDLLVSQNKNKNDYPNSKRLNYILTHMPKEVAEKYASEFINILRIHKQK